MSPTADARGVVETLQEEYPGVEVVAKREHEPSLQIRQGFRAGIDDALTDHLRTATRKILAVLHEESPTG